MTFGRDEIYGATRFLFHQSKPYRDHLICPTTQSVSPQYGFAILNPSCDGEWTSREVYWTAEEAIAVAKTWVDHSCTYWFWNQVAEEWHEKGLLTERELRDAISSLDRWDADFWKVVYSR